MVTSTLPKFFSTLKRRIQLRDNFHVQAASALLARLSPREQRFVAAAGIALGCALLYLLLLDPLWQMRLDLHARVRAKERELQEIMTLRQTYLEAKTAVERMQSTVGPGFSPVSFLEELINATISQDKVTAITPLTQETQAGATLETIELKLTGVSLREIVELLYKIDTTGAMFHPTRLSIKKRYKDPYTFDVFLSTVAVSPR
jgi:type II secretory pathway component PulM